MHFINAKIDMEVDLDVANQCMLHNMSIMAEHTAEEIILSAYQTKLYFTGLGETLWLIITCRHRKKNLDCL